ncbi:hypothetical protein DFA_01066 [Cavenderia fasciculata]|uniref:Uncharacterized protein n=1 Tax=Cavenderia fasciculata TaxID=261658 RepID=F4PQM4_CACFS|nr:uncharacterized protein DFA_01066 [Cavenderia fasciculata]EGG21191.1 hypothetical protein DFA_01066 [Cavenderia fasciculata]|eukprot:XP_004359041.1 hypothetical protein DFA_01066 [Cavenderia fasciculata]
MNKFFVFALVVLFVATISYANCTSTGPSSSWATTTGVPTPPPPPRTTAQVSNSVNAQITGGNGIAKVDTEHDIQTQTEDYATHLNTKSTTKL